MPSTRRKTNKAGQDFYEIRVSRGRGKSYLTRRWYVPEGWSQKAIDRELAKVAAEFEREVHAGEIISRAEQKEKDLQAKLEADKIQTLKQYGERVFMPSKLATITENTRSSFQGNLDRWIYPALGSYKLPEITPAQITALLVNMQAQGKAHATVVKVYSILLGLFKMAYLSDMIPRNPMDKVERPRPRKDEVKATTADAYTPEDVRAIMDSLTSEPLKWQAFIHVLIDTGIRRGECCGLQWKDIDFQAGEATICRNLCYTPKKGVYLDTPKNGKTRIVTISSDTLELLRRLRLEQSERAISPYVFTQDGTPEPMHPTSPTHYFRQFSMRYNVPGFHPHKLRHTFASIAITAGADVASVSEALGHSDKAVTLRMYTHADEESRRRAAEIFQSAIKNAGQK